MKVAALLLETPKANVRAARKHTHFEGFSYTGFRRVIKDCEKAYPVDYAWISELHNYDYALLSLHSNKEVENLVHSFEKYKPKKGKCKIVIGGAGVINVKLYSSYIDVVCFGRGENQILDILHGAEAPNIWRKEDDPLFSKIYEIRQAQEIIEDEAPTVGCPNKCLRGDTVIHTIEGDFPIEELVGKEDVRVMTRDPNTYEPVFVPAIHIRKTGTNENLVRVHFTDRTHIDCTPDHKFMRIDGFSAEAKDLKSQVVKGVKLYKEVREIETLVEKDDVYCMEVPGIHWFYANKVLVHNCQFCQYTYVRKPFNYDKVEGHYTSAKDKLSPASVEDDWRHLEVKDGRNYTTAWDGFSEETRRLINKPIADKDITNKLMTFYNKGIKADMHIKIYGIVGYPWETWNTVVRDINNVADLLHSVDQKGKYMKLRLFFQITPFMSEPLTPMQCFKTSTDVNWRNLSKYYNNKFYRGNNIEAIIYPYIPAPTTVLKRQYVNRGHQDDLEKFKQLIFNKKLNSLKSDTAMYAIKRDGYAPDYIAGYIPKDKIPFNYVKTYLDINRASDILEKKAKDLCSKGAYFWQT